MPYRECADPDELAIRNWLEISFTFRALRSTPLPGYASHLPQGRVERAFRIGSDVLEAEAWTSNKSTYGDEGTAHRRRAAVRFQPGSSGQA